MIIGHVGVAFAAKRQWPRLPLSVLLATTFAPDLLRLALAATGLPFATTNLYSHALPWCVLLAVVAGALAWSAMRDRRALLVVSAVMMSHIVLDAFSGRKPLWSNGPPGLDMGAFEQLELVVESALLVGGWLMLRRTRAPRWATSRAVPVLLILVQVASALGSISQRPYNTRCLAYPMRACTEASALTRRWETTPFW